MVLATDHIVLLYIVVELLLLLGDPLEFGDAGNDTRGGVLKVSPRKPDQA